MTSTHRRLDPSIFDLPVEKMRAGWYTDAYFNHTRATLIEDGRHPNVVMQVFQKRNAYLGGMDEAIAVLKLCADTFSDLTVHALYDGDSIEPYETVMTIEGDLNIEVGNVVTAINLKQEQSSSTQTFDKLPAEAEQKKQ